MFCNLQFGHDEMSKLYTLIQRMKLYDSLSRSISINFYL